MHEPEVDQGGGSRRDMRQQAPTVVLPTAPPVQQARSKRKRGGLWVAVGGTALVLLGLASIAGGLLSPVDGSIEIAAIGAQPASAEKDAGQAGQTSKDNVDKGGTPDEQACPAIGGDAGAALLRCQISAPDADSARPGDRNDRQIENSVLRPGSDSSPGATRPGTSTPGTSGPGTSSPGTSGPGTTPSQPAPSNPTPGEPAPSNPAPSNPTPAEPKPSEPAPSNPTPTNPTPTNPTPSEPAPAPAQPKPLAFVDIQRNGLIVLLTSYTLTMTGEPGATASITYGGRSVGSVKFDSAGKGKLLIPGSLIDLGLANPTIRAAYSDGTAGSAISAPRDSI